jgi:hypothetical protein
MMHLNLKRIRKKGRLLDTVKWFKEINGVLEMGMINRLKISVCMHP